MVKDRKTNVSWPELFLKGRTYLFYACGTSKCDNLDRCSRNMIIIKICILKNYHVLVMLEIPLIYIVNGYLIGLVEPHKVSCSICFPYNCQWIKEIIKPLWRWIQSLPNSFWLRNCGNFARFFFKQAPLFVTCSTP